MLRKYPNRRLYDTSTGATVKALEIKPRLLAGETVTMKDGTDVTGEVFLTIMRVDMEAGKGPTLAALRSFIAEYSEPTPAVKRGGVQ